MEMPANIHTHGKSKGAACEEENEYSLSVGLEPTTYGS